MSFWLELSCQNITPENARVARTLINGKRSMSSCCMDVLFAVIPGLHILSYLIVV